jgi:Domain of unknown function (DUF6458)
MGIGGGIFLMAVGAILTFGITVEPHWLDLDVVGWVLMTAGGTLIVLTIWFWQEKRRRNARLLAEEARRGQPYGQVLPDPPDVELQRPTEPSEPPRAPPRRAAPPS